MMPIAPDHLAVERFARADRHRQNGSGLRNRLDFDGLAESDVAVVDGLQVVSILAFDAERGNPEADFDGL
jgi:hypothetical protein